jgi:hypothetical protein
MKFMKINWNPSTARTINTNRDWGTLRPENEPITIRKVTVRDGKIIVVIRYISAIVFNSAPNLLTAVLCSHASVSTIDSSTGAKSVPALIEFAICHTVLLK